MASHLLKVLMILLIISSFGFKSNEPPITNLGYKNFIIGVTSMSSVKRDYPNYTHTRFLLSDTSFMEELSFKEIGIHLIFFANKNSNLDSIYLHGIDIRSPATIKTEKNIGVGSTLEKLFQQYDPNHAIPTKKR